MKPKRIFISGPISGNAEYARIHRFKPAFIKLLLKGYEPFNPFTMMDIWPRKSIKNWHFWMRNGLKFLIDCDAIYMLKGWRKSRGARLEHKIAQELGMEIIYAEY